MCFLVEKSYLYRLKFSLKNGKLDVNIAKFKRFSKMFLDLLSIVTYLVR